MVSPLCLRPEQLYPDACPHRLFLYGLSGSGGGGHCERAGDAQPVSGRPAGGEHGRLPLHGLYLPVHVYRFCLLSGHFLGRAGGGDGEKRLALGCGIEDPNYYYPISIEEALKAPVNKKVILTGTISGIKSAWDTGYKNMEAWLSDGQGNEILLYRIKTQVGVGDKVTVQGVIGVYKEVNQIAQSGSTVTIDEKHVCSDFTEATCQAAATCKVCGAINGDKAEHTMVDGVCSVCGHEEGAAEAVDLTLSFADKANRTEFTTSKQVWAKDGVTLTNDKGSSTSNVADYANPARFYKGSKITVAVEGKTITKIVFNCNSNDYAKALNNSIAAADGVTVTVNAKVVTVEFATPVDSFVIASLTGGQVRMDSMVVTCK